MYQVKMRKSTLAATGLLVCQLGVMTAAESSVTATATTSTTATSEVITTTTTTVVKNVVKEEKKSWRPLKVCVLDFTGTDTRGQKQFLDAKNNSIAIPAQNTLNSEDRKSINSVMQGFVRMIDAYDSTRTNDTNRDARTDDNRFTRAKALELYKTVVKGEARPMVLGAEYLSTYLGRHNDVFTCLDAGQMAVVMGKLEKQPDFPADFMLKLARETGATHLIYGTVSDMRSSGKEFSGYNIKTKSTNYQLDVMIKVVDLVRQSTVFSNVYTGTYREQKQTGGGKFDNNIFQTLMTSALEQAAEELYDISKPGRKNRLSATPLPYTVRVLPSGGMFFKAADAEIYINDVLAGRGGDAIVVPAGRHKFEIRAKGYKNNSFDYDVKGNADIKPALSK